MGPDVHARGSGVEGVGPSFVVGHVDPEAEDVGERARRRMHGIFVGEIQALEEGKTVAAIFSETASLKGQVR